MTISILMNWAPSGPYETGRYCEGCSFQKITFVGAMYDEYFFQADKED